MVNIATQTSDTAIRSIFEKQQLNQYKIAQTTAVERIAKLDKLSKVIFQFRSEIKTALWNDFKKPALEVDLTEIFIITTEIKHIKRHLRTWMNREYVPTPITHLGSTSWIQYEPKGVCLIISPWNYPFQLAIEPLVSAIAAGNTVILKPSEIAPNTSAIIKKIITLTFSEDEVAVIEGGVDTSTKLLNLPFNHIFFTGSPQVGKIVMAAAAKNLTSVTLELGGKSPTIIDETANLKSATKRLVWAKFMNNGQICLAPDYVLVHESKKNELLDLLAKTLKDFYGDDPQQSSDYMRIINEKHCERLDTYLQNSIKKGAKVTIGGNTNIKERYVAPTILADVPLDSDVMEYEIFGPILPIITFKNNQEVIDIIRKKEKPLGLYIYSNSKKNIDFFLKNTTAGGTTINNSAMHFSNNNLPFGGVNNSGIGKAHGHFGFKAFSNARGVYRQNLPGVSEIFSPPYTNLKQKLVDLVLRWF